jgi:hypothetical protein
VSNFQAQPGIVETKKMNCIDYVSRITFRLIKPHTPIATLGFAKGICGLRPGLLFRAFCLFETFNTRLPRNYQTMKRRLQSIIHIPRMSTFAIGAVINRGVRQMRAGQVFVNVGVWHGFTLLAGMVDNDSRVCIGVDNFSQYGGPKELFNERFVKYRSNRHHFYEMDYVDYFSDVHREPIGFYIYDGEHNYEEQLRGLRIAEPYFSDGCIVLIDDTNYPDVRQAVADFLAASLNTYRTFSETTFCNSHPTFWNGITILQKAG